MKSGRRIAQALVTAVLIGPRLMHAQVSGTWVTPFSGGWLNPINWSSNPLYPTDGGTATFPSYSIGPIAVGGIPFNLISEIEFSGPAHYTILGSQGFNLVEPAIIETIGPSSSSLKVVDGHFLNTAFGGTAGFEKRGSGILKLGPGNVYSGGTTVSGGILIFTDSTSFGSGSVVLNGGTLLGIGTTSYPLSVPIHVDPQGGTLSAPDFGTPYLGAGTISSSITGGGTLKLLGQSSDQNFSSYGFDLTAASGFGGTLHVATNVSLSGSMNSIQAAVLSGGVSFGVGSTTSSKIADSATVTMRGGSIVAFSAHGSLATETVGNVIIDRGLNILGNDILKLSVQGIERPSSGILSIGPRGIQIAGSPPSLIGSGASGTPEVGIVPWARLNEFVTRPVTVDEIGLMRPLNDSEFINTLPVGVTASNFRPSGGSMEVTTPITVNSLTLGSTLTGSGTVTVTSGAVFITIGSGPVELPSRMSAPLNFGATEGILHTRRAASASAVIDASISGTAGLAIPGYVALRGASTYTGPTTILGRADIRSDVYPGIPGPLGADVSPVVLESSSILDASNQQITGQLLLHVVTNPITFGRDLIVRSVDQSYAAIGLAAPDVVPTGPSTLSGNVLLEGDLWLTGEHGIGSFVVSGDIQGPGRLMRVDDVILTGNNSFTGGVIVKTRSITAGSNTAFGAGTLWITGNGTISSTGSVTLNNPAVIQGNARFGGSERIGFSGPIDLFGGMRTMELVNSNVTAFTGSIFNGGLVKTGSGTAEFSRLQVATLNVDAGHVKMIQSSDASYTRALSIAAGASVDLTNNTLVFDHSGVNAAMTRIKQYLADGRLFTSEVIPGSTTIGYAESSILGFTSFAGHPIAGTALLIKYTYFGDANLDGRVDARDLVRLADGWLAAGSWVNGDFDGDGTVNQVDLTLLAQNWQAGQGAPLGAALDQLGLPSVEVPEPIGIVAIIGVVRLLKGRRRS